MQSWLWSDIETVLVENWPVRGLASLEFGRRGEFDMETWEEFGVDVCGGEFL